VAGAAPEGEVAGAPLLDPDDEAVGGAPALVPPEEPPEAPPLEPPEAPPLEPLVAGGPAGFAGARTEVPLTTGPAVWTVVEVPVALTVAWFGSVVPEGSGPEAEDAATVRARSTLWSGSRLPTFQVTVCPETVQPPVQETNVTFGPSVSDTVAPAHGVAPELSRWR